MEEIKVLTTWSLTDPERELIHRYWPSNAKLLTKETPTISNTAQTEWSAQADVVVGLMSGITLELLQAAPKLRLVHLLGHGADALLAPDIVRQLKLHGVSVARAGAAAVAIAEFTVMAMVSLSRRLLNIHDALARYGDWSVEKLANRPFGTVGGELGGRTLGLMGFGTIGQQIARRALGFDMDIVTLTRRPDLVQLETPAVSRAYGPTEFFEFLERTDYLVIAAPLTDETRGLVDEAALARLKTGSYLVNISRGPIVDEEALYRALESGRLAGAALDVWCSEDNGHPKGYPTTQPIHQFNVIMTPHYAGITQEARERALRIVGENLSRVGTEQPFLNLVDLEAGY